MGSIITLSSRKMNNCVGSPVSTKDRICSRIIEYGILGLIIFSPLPAASVNPWSILVIELAILTMLAAYILMSARPQLSEFLAAAVRWPRRLFVGLFLFILIQTVPFLGLSFSTFAGAYNYQRLYAVDFSQVKFLSFSIIPSVTLQKGLEFLAYFLFGLLILKTVTRRGQINRIIAALIAVGAFEAIYGLLELYHESPGFYFIRRSITSIQ